MVSVPQQALELEQWHRALRTARATLAEVAAFERIGRADDHETADRMVFAKARATADQIEASGTLELFLATFRESCPRAVEAWAAAHQRLLDDLMARNRNGTVRFVAKAEREQWDEVARGERDHVQSNTYYIEYDRDLYRALFGFGPDTIDEQ